MLEHEKQTGRFYLIAVFIESGLHFFSFTSHALTETCVPAQIGLTC